MNDSQLAKSKDLKHAAQLKEYYGFDFPDDFWLFWDFYKELNDCGMVELLTDTLGITLHGPFDLLRGDFDEAKPKFPLYLNWRFYKDPPEFFTVLMGTSDGEHWGYWLDDPAAARFCVASYYNNDAYEISNDGETLFEAVRLELEYSYSSNIESIAMYTAQNNSTEVEYAKQGIERLAKLRTSLCKYETAQRTQIGSDYTEAYNTYFTSTRHSSLPTFDSMGFVVEPKYLSDQLYETPAINDDNIKDVIAKAEEYIKNGYYGNAMAIGKDLFSYGKKFQSEAQKILTECYNKLERPLLAQILNDHFKYRDKGTVCILDWQDETA